MIKEWRWHLKPSSVIEGEVYLPSPGVVKGTLASGDSFAAAIFKRFERFVRNLRTHNFKEFKNKL
jgi:hypothetical protein